MCTKDNLFQRFIVDGQEFIDCQDAFLRKVDEYYKDQKDPRDPKDTKNEEITQ
jgi:genome maintenance exonuclease 1